MMLGDCTCPVATGRGGVHAKHGTDDSRGHTGEPRGKTPAGVAAGSTLVSLNGRAVTDALGLPLRRDR